MNTTDLNVDRPEHAIFGNGTFDCEMEHNEDGAELLFTLPCGIVPVAVATCTHNSLSHLYFLALRDFPNTELESYEDGVDGECEDNYVRAGKFYFVEVNHCEGREPTGKREVIDLESGVVYPRESHENTEWMNGMFARHLCQQDGRYEDNYKECPTCGARNIYIPFNERN